MIQEDLRPIEDHYFVIIITINFEMSQYDHLRVDLILYQVNYFISFKLMMVLRYLKANLHLNFIKLQLHSTIFFHDLMF